MVSSPESLGGKALLWEVGGIHRLAVESPRAETLLGLKSQEEKIRKQRVGLFSSAHDHSDGRLFRETAS